MKNTFIYLVFTFFTFWLAGCIGDPEPAVDYSERDEELISTHLAENGITNATRHSSGLYYTIDEPGISSTDSIIYNSPVVLHYEGRLLDGTLFDSSKERAAPAVLIPQNLIYGWQIALPLLNRGSKATLYVPSHLGYGNQQLGTIPANSVLKFEMEVLDFFPSTASYDTVYSVASAETIRMYLEKKNITDTEVTASGLHYRVLEEGTGTEHPALNDSIKVAYTGSLINDEEFDGTADGESISFILDNNLIKGWTEGVQKMKKGEKAQLIIPSPLAYRSNATGSIPANSVLIFEIELIDFGF
ncbi:FKBP-type peptidyl-prolyl cis-trans isomerase [Flammeovirgaceae bacterium SG7u.111]|nr:FKBP-type peptidyl-prolyl cis-trans isomerase [Flammeovirgaceae bacterium SG7u.132]WPO37395.1 FKBP-type peptidyl-prolyl cis-trans isomerase [Flammeovirgaceae bacterium SG7u.111]